MSAIPCASVSLKTMADGTLRISFDIEPKDAQDAFRLFAAPGTPAAIAALQVGYEAVQPAISKMETPDKPKGGALAKLAGMWCNDPEFYRFVMPVYDVFMGGDGKGCGDVSIDDFEGSMKEYCKHVILVMCYMDSRAELDNDPEVAEKFNRLFRGPYSRHLMARGIVT